MVWNNGKKLDKPHPLVQEQIDENDLRREII